MNYATNPLLKGIKAKDLRDCFVNVNDANHVTRIQRKRVRIAESGPANVGYRESDSAAFRVFWAKRGY